MIRFVHRAEELPRLGITGDRRGEHASDEFLFVAAVIAIVLDHLLNLGRRRFRLRHDDLRVRIGERALVDRPFEHVDVDPFPVRAERPLRGLHDVQRVAPARNRHRLGSIEVEDRFIRAAVEDPRFVDDLQAEAVRHLRDLLHPHVPGFECVAVDMRVALHHLEQAACFLIARRSQREELADDDVIDMRRRSAREQREVVIEKRLPLGFARRRPREDDFRARFLGADVVFEDRHVLPLPVLAERPGRVFDDAQVIVRPRLDFHPMDRADEHALFARVANPHLGKEVAVGQAARGEAVAGARDRSAVARQRGRENESNHAIRLADSADSSLPPRNARTLSSCVSTSCSPISIKRFV